METLKHYVDKHYSGNIAAAARSLGYKRQNMSVMVAHGGYYVVDGDKLVMLVKDLSEVKKEV